MYRRHIDHARAVERRDRVIRIARPGGGIERGNNSFEIAALDQIVACAAGKIRQTTF
jgi:hypothetical protein